MVRANRAAARARECKLGLAVFAGQLLQCKG